MGEFSLDAFDQRMERTRRADTKSVRVGPESFGIEFGDGRGGVFVFLRGGSWNRDGRLDCITVIDQWIGRDQTDGWIDTRRGDRSGVAAAGYGGADGADGNGCRVAAGGACRGELRAGARSQRAEGRADRRGAADFRVQRSC